VVDGALLVVGNQYGEIELAALCDVERCDGLARRTALLRPAMVQSPTGRKDDSFPPYIEGFRDDPCFTGEANVGLSDRFTLRQSSPTPLFYRRVHRQPFCHSGEVAPDGFTG
jgi:hypothetical protein